MASRTKKCLAREAYTVALICPLEVEMSAARYMLDEEHARLPPAIDDTNQYILGQLSGHNVALVSLPAAYQGTVSAATVASHMARTFPSITLRLLVGIGGGVPSDKVDIHLGDVVMSIPSGTQGGVVEYDLGKQTPTGFLRKGFLCPPPTEWLTALTIMKSDHRVQANRISEFISKMLEKFPGLVEYKRPPPQTDVLFQPDYIHGPDKNTCEDCDKGRAVNRPGRQARDVPVVHYGLIASGDRVMKDATERDKISKDLEGVICFEMEAAGLMNDFRCIVIRGISDYADSHKNDIWYPYAAAAAAGLAKEMLSYIPVRDINKPASPEDEAKNNQCLRDLQSTDPRIHKERIEDSKDHLLRDSYMWILDDQHFRDWWDSNDNSLLWIKGDPGKGKTMMMIGLVDELSKRLKTKPGSGILSYFFCQSTGDRFNNAVSVLRGLIYLLAVEHRTLIRHVRNEHDKMGKQLFEGEDAFYVLRRILSEMLKDSGLPRVYLMLDALDECDSSLPQLLDLIASHGSEPSSRVKWLVASRNRFDIEERLRPDDLRLKTDLELNPDHISRAVEAFIDFKILELAKRKSYENKLHEEVKSYLYKKAEGTFLWVALVCKRLEKVSRNAKVLDVLKEFPSGLEPLYERMMDQIRHGEDAEHVELCTRILSTVTLMYRPIHLKELVVAVDLPEERPDLQSLNKLVDLCGSFLTVRKETVYFVHQSAKDYFSTGKGSEIFPSSKAERHRVITCRCLQHMSGTLKRNVCGLSMPGTLLNEANISVNLNPLAHIQYACCYWVDHLSQVSPLQQDEVGKVDEFLRKNFLHWLEALSLIGEMSKGVLMISDLQYLLTELDKRNAKWFTFSRIFQLAETNRSDLLTMVNDAKRFIHYGRSIIERAPLQTYNSALIFSPKRSIVRKQFLSEFPSWIKSVLVVEEDWTSCLQTLEGHSGWITSVAFSSDNQRLASGSYDGTVKLWNVKTGALRNTLNGHSGLVSSVAFSPDDQRLMSGSYDGTVKLWNAETRALQSTLNGHSYPVNPVAFSPDDQPLASGSSGETVKLRNAKTGALDVLKGYSDRVNSVAFSPDGQRLASGSNDKTVKLWNAKTGVLQNILNGHSGLVSSVAFSPDGQRLVSGSFDNTVKLWNAKTGALQNTLNGHSGRVSSVAFSPDGQCLASGSSDMIVRLWSATGTLQSTLKGHSRSVNSVTFSLDGQRLASGSSDSTVKLWNTKTRTLQSTLKGHSNPVSSVSFSSDGQRLASGSSDRTVKLWNVRTEVLQSTLKDHSSWVSSVAFSPDSQCLASGSFDKTVKLWNAKTGSLQSTLKGHSGWVNSVAFSPDGQRLASGSFDKTVKLWSAETRALQSTLKGHSGSVNSVAFSPDGQRLASGSNDDTVKLWNAKTGALQRTLKDHLGWVSSVAFSPDSQCLASGSFDKTVKLWNAKTGALQSTLKGHLGLVCSVAFSPDGQCLASKSDDNTVKLWNANTGALQSTLKGYLNAEAYIRASLYFLDETHQWVTWKNRNVLFLPPDYRPNVYKVQDNILAIGRSSGQLTILEFDPNIDPLEFSDCSTGTTSGNC